jgi:Uma2 family endonuclease
MNRSATLKAAPQVEILPVTLRLQPAIYLTDEQLYELCQLNGELQIERTAEGELLIMSPEGGETANRNFELSGQFRNWVNQDGTGVGFGASAGFLLPNGAMRSPDLAWVKRSRLVGLTQYEKVRFLSLCPDLVVELRSRTDRLRTLQAKMREYIENGAELGWLLDPISKRVYVYRPQGDVEVLENPATISGDPVLPEFVPDLQRIWEPGL